MLAFPLILINSKFFFGNRENRQNSVKCFTIPDITCFNWFVCSSVAVHRRPVRCVEVGLNEMARYAADLMPLSVKMRENLFWNLLKTCENQNATPTNSAVVNRVRFSWENTNNTQSKPWASEHWPTFTWVWTQRRPAGPSRRKQLKREESKTAGGAELSLLIQPESCRQITCYFTLGGFTASGDAGAYVHASKLTCLDAKARVVGDRWWR